jgi:NAD(P)-dependent dehydrogenase (short-subunit alcohol dehydrogenase family)
MGKLVGKVAIVTGASRGIGRATAVVLASEGASVVCASRTLEEGERVEMDPAMRRNLRGSLRGTVDIIAKAGGTAIAVKTDISNERNCFSLVETARCAFGPVDVLVNDAVISYYYPIKDYPTSVWMHCFSVNIHAPFILSKLVIPDMIEKGQGRIVNISSRSAVGPGRGPYMTGMRSFKIEDLGRWAGGNMYGTTKAALERFTQGLAQEVYEYGISVASVAPSTYAYTPTTEFLFGNTAEDAEKNGESPDMMARAVLLLATEPLDKVAGRVTYSQAILKEFGWIDEARGLGIDPDLQVTGYSQQ